MTRYVESYLKMIGDTVVRIHATKDIAIITIMSDAIFARFNILRDFPRNGHLTRPQYRGSSPPLKSKSAHIPLRFITLLKGKNKARLKGKQNCVSYSKLHNCTIIVEMIWYTYLVSQSASVATGIQTSSSSNRSTVKNELSVIKLLRGWPATCNRN